MLCTLTTANKYSPQHQLIPYTTFCCTVHCKPPYSPDYCEYTKDNLLLLRMTVLSRNYSVHPMLDMRISFLCPFVRPSVCGAHSTPPSWILKRGGLESPGQRLIFLSGKTTGIAFFSAKKIFSKF